jgi:hypothetical protein
MGDVMLAEAEEAMREAGFDYPLAWALGFLSDNYDVLWESLSLTASGRELVDQFDSLVDEILNGFEEVSDG